MIDLDTLVLGPCMQAWGQPVTFQPAAGLPQAGLLGNFDEKYRTVAFTDGDESVTQKPMLGIQASAFLQQPVKGDAFLIVGRLWRVIDVLADGHGHLHIALAFLNDAQVSVPVVPPPVVSGL